MRYSTVRSILAPRLGKPIDGVTDSDVLDFFLCADQECRDRNSPRDPEGAFRAWQESQNRSPQDGDNHEELPLWVEGALINML